MTETKHTPGPWRIGESGNQGESCGIYADLITIAWVSDEGPWTFNAELIASAPSQAARIAELEQENQHLNSRVSEYFDWIQELKTQRDQLLEAAIDFIGSLNYFTGKTSAVTDHHKALVAAIAAVKSH